MDTATIIFLAIVIIFLIGLVILFINGDIVSSRGLRKTFRDDNDDNGNG